MEKIAPYAKSIVAALVAGLGALGTALTDGGVSAQEWVAVASATLVGLGVVFGVPNADPAGDHQDESVQPPRNEEGSTLVTVLVVVALILGIVFLWQRI